ncbi:uncharacterized protein BXZ73DRAFT_22343, partial [Epithele typhae]|uniref:uncharacterized protein n=1 Tax=Epithele typhae TaxID=378194 RepID=UPI0020085237
PFDQPSVDLILRSSDRVDFYVHRNILAQASPVFADMRSIPQPSPISQEEAFDPPIVNVSEDEKTLRRLLFLCYPLKKPDIESLRDVELVLTAAIKYDMEWPISSLSDRLQSSANEHPLQVWAIACRASLEGIAQNAAAKMKAPRPSTTTMETSLKTLIGADGLGVLEGISAGVYFRLREYLSS